MNSAKATTFRSQDVNHTSHGLPNARRTERCARCGRTILEAEQRVLDSNDHGPRYRPADGRCGLKIAV